MDFECVPCFVWCFLETTLLALDRIEVHLKDYGVGYEQDLSRGVQVLCGHCFLIVFNLGDEIFEVSLSIDCSLQ